MRREEAIETVIRAKLDGATHVESAAPTDYRTRSLVIETWGVLGHAALEVLVFVTAWVYWRRLPLVFADVEGAVTYRQAIPAGLAIAGVWSIVLNLGVLLFR